MDAHELELVLERCDSTEFKETNNALAEALWAIITTTINEKTPDAQPGIDDVWNNFYKPAMRQGILRRLAEKCRKGEEGWHEAFCNSVREAGDIQVCSECGDVFNAAEEGDGEVCDECVAHQEGTDTE